LEEIEGGYEWGQKMYETILVPPAVLRELAAGMTDDVDDYLAHFGISDLLRVEAPASSDLEEARHLDPGEQEAIALAAERGLPLLIEEEAGRSAARTLGIEISGIAGQILRAVREGTTSSGEGQRMLVALREKGRINQNVFEGVRAAIEEESELPNDPTDYGKL
jgi:predicted nucleic acid-binding protein